MVNERKWATIQINERSVIAECHRQPFIAKKKKNAWGGGVGAHATVPEIIQVLDIKRKMFIAIFMLGSSESREIFC